MIEQDKPRLPEGSRRIDTNGKAELPPPAQARGGNAFPNIPLFAHTGERFRLYEDLIKDRIVVLHFFTIRGQKAFPSVRHMENIAKHLKGRLGSEVFIYSVSQDIRDTPARLKHFAARYEVPKGWYFLTALPEDVEALSDRLQRSACNHRGSHSPRMVHYGNGGVGMWGAFGVDSDPAFAAERVSWVATAEGPVPAGAPRRAGPRRLGNDFAHHNRET